MQPAEHVFGRARVIVLHKIHVTPGVLDELPAVESFKKEAALVAEHFGFDDEDVGDCGGDNFHLSFPEFSCCVEAKQRAHELTGRAHELTGRAQLANRQLVKLELCEHPGCELTGDVSVGSRCHRRAQRYF